MACSPLSAILGEIMNFVEQTPPIRFERAVHSAGRAAGIGAGWETLTAVPCGIISNRQVALDQIHFFPIFVDKRRGRKGSRREAQKPGAAAASLFLVQGAGEDL